METEEILTAIQRAAETIATPNWVDKLAIIISALAILVASDVAIYVAKKQNKIIEKQTEIAKKQAEIAEQQNKIVLFEKRYELYCLVQKCIFTAGLLSTLPVNNANEMYKCFFVEFDDVILKNESVGKYRIIVSMLSVADKLDQTEFLFSKDTSKYILQLAARLRILMAFDAPANQDKTLIEVKNSYCQIANDLEADSILNKMKLELQPILTR